MGEWHCYHINIIFDWLDVNAPPIFKNSDVPHLHDKVFCEATHCAANHLCDSHTRARAFLRRPRKWYTKLYLMSWTGACASC